MTLTRRTALAALAGACSHAAEWTPLFDGKSLAGWKETPFTGRGPVHIQDAAILLGKGYMTGITWTGPFPTSGYEIRYESARIEGNDFFGSIIFPVHDTHCSWINGGWGGSTVGLSSIENIDASENETSTDRDFTKGLWYAFRLAVTPARIQAWIDNALVIDLDTTNRKLSLRFDETDLCKPLGFASYATVAALRKIEYRRIPAN